MRPSRPLAERRPGATGTGSRPWRRRSATPAASTNRSRRQRDRRRCPIASGTTRSRRRHHCRTGPPHREVRHPAPFSAAARHSRSPRHARPLGPDPRPTPNPRFPLLESLAPPRPSHRLPGAQPRPARLAASRPARPAEQRAARLKADREGVRPAPLPGLSAVPADVVRGSPTAGAGPSGCTNVAEQLSRGTGRDWLRAGTELRQAGRTMAAQRWHREAHEARAPRRPSLARRPAGARRASSAGAR